MLARSMWTVLVLLLVASSSNAQNPYRSNSSGGGYGYSSQRKMPSFGVGSYDSPQSGNISGNSRLSSTYPRAPRVRRPVISPYLNLNRPEGIIGGVPNYYSLVRPEKKAFDRYKSGVNEFRQFENDTARKQQELYLQQQRDFEQTNERISREKEELEAGRPRSGSIRTRYGRSGMRPTGHATSFGAR